MDAIELLLNRVSMPKLSEPGPTAEQLDVIYRAALRTPDHGGIRPWRFISVAGDARKQLGEVFQQAAKSTDPSLDETKFNKLGLNPLRAPLIIVVVASVSEHPKVPALEQIVSAGAAAQNMMLAAFAQGIGGMWRTGEMAYHPVVQEALGLNADEEIIGYLYLGTQPDKLKKVPQLDPVDFVTEWNVV